MIGGSVPVASALLQQVGVSAEAAEIAEAGLATNTLEPAGNTEVLRCSFCNKDHHDVERLIAGPSVFICDECVEVCNDIIADDIRFAARSRG